MGRLVPEDYPLSLIPNDAERRVVEAFRDRLTDGWLVIPDIALRDDRDYQLDLVLVHEEWGVLDIEVKGHRVDIRNGLWCDRNGQLNPQPMNQARSNAYALRTRLRQLGVPALQSLSVDYGVALPNSPTVTGRLPADTNRVQILTAAELEDPQPAIEALASARFRFGRLGREGVEAVVRFLRPDADFGWDPEARSRATRGRLDQLCADQVGALETLDANRMVYVAGRAGTGKTRLAMAWARRAAFVRGERVLLTCYNDPLAVDMRARLPQDDDLVIAPFLRMAFQLDGMPELAVPDNADHEWWNTQASAHFQRHWHKVTDRFDTIVVDEGQDFSPVWLAQLQELLDPEGPRRMMVVADNAQDLFDRGFHPPSPEDGWAVAELLNNCRNSHEIASLLRRRLDGARAPMVGPQAAGLRWVSAEDPAELTAAVGAELGRLFADERDPRNVLIATVASDVRDALRGHFALGRWEDRESGRVVCENVHRVKGLEADCVILVAADADVSDALLYVGISRAVSELVVIGPVALAERLGMARSPAE